MDETTAPVRSRPGRQPEQRDDEVDQAVAAEVVEAVQAAEQEAAELNHDPPLYGSPGRPLNRRSPFTVGLFGAFGVALAYLIVRMLLDASSVLVLIGLALFLAIGLDPGGPPSRSSPCSASRSSAAFSPPRYRRW
jgi:hypothetical protein